jgi:murein DD-endopeptidase MepM/ murein hydrolase activator NlpD
LLITSEKVIGMQSNRPKRHLGQKLIVLFSSATLLGSGLAIPLQGANAQAKAPVENNFTEIPVVDSPVVSASESLAAPVLTVPTAPLASEPILRTMQENSTGESIAREQVPVLINPVDSFADSNDYGLATRPSNPSNPAANESRPETIVLNERSTGCAKVLVNGAVPDQICPITELAPTPLAIPSPPTIANLSPGVRPVSVFGMEVTPGGFRLASNSTADKSSSNFFSRNRPLGRPGAGRGTFMFPLTIPSVITSIFGWRVHPISGGYRFHSGTDLGADQGTPVIAVTDGRVATADYLGGYGLTIILRHENDTQESLYAHMSQILVQPGEEVTQGTVIGLVGSTGNSTGPHLHFEWRVVTNDGWVAVDPTNHLQFALEQFMLALENPTAKPLFSRLPNAE